MHNLKNYLEPIRQEHNRQAAIKEKYGINSLDKLIVDIDGELIKLNTRKELGENVDLAIRNKDEQRRKYEKSLEKLVSVIEKERSLPMSMPIFLGVIQVKRSIRSVHILQQVNFYLSENAVYLDFDEELTRRVLLCKHLTDLLYLEKRFLYLLIYLIGKVIRLERILIIVLSCSITSLSLFAFYVDVSVYASSPLPPFTESQENLMISSSIETANTHIDEATKAVQNDNSTQALMLLSQLRTDISNINSNVTNLIFTVTAQPP